jgi:hypothetical protein
MTKCDDPIECGHEAALGQWEARWEMLRDHLNPREQADAEMLVMLDRIEKEVITGQPVMHPEVQVWVVRMFPERWKRLIEVLRSAGAHPSGLGSYEAANDANNFADIIETQVGL